MPSAAATCRARSASSFLSAAGAANSTPARSRRRSRQPCRAATKRRRLSILSRDWGSEEQAMASVVNLNRFRKAKKRAAAERRAAENRTAFGRSKPERKLVEHERDRIDRDLEGKKLE